MDTSDPEITFDASGHCNHCVAHGVKIQRLRDAGRFGEEHLPALVARLKAAGTGRRYDAVLGVSGGGDSSFLALSLARLGVRLLLVHVDNGWDTADAVANIKAVAEASEQDYQSFVLDWAEFKDLQVAFLKASVVEAETPTDLAISGALHRVAAANGVSIIVSASNETSEGILPRTWHYDSKDLRYFSSINRKYGAGPTRLYPSFGLWNEAYYKVLRGITIFYPLNYLGYDPAAARSFLKVECGWRDYGGKHHESHYTRFVQSYLLPTKFGIDYRRATLSSLICMGQIRREDALSTLSSLPFDEASIPRQKQYIATKLELPLDEFQSYLDQPPRWYRDYPNNERLLGLSYSLYRQARRLLR